MDESITVAIVTRNRARDLEDCLQSLAKQRIAPACVLVVNNNSTDETHEVVNKYKQHFPTREVFEKNVGYPVVYNRALKEAKTTWIAFIDDDCVADTRWYSEVEKATKRHTEYAALLGASFNYYSKNPYACALQFSNEWWKEQSIRGNQVRDYRALDSRNIIYNVKALQKKHIRFDPTFILGAEDSDLGLQLQKNSLKAKYIQQMRVFHKEPRSLGQFFRKKIAYGRAQKYLFEKRGIPARSLAKKKQWVFMKKSFAMATHGLSFYQKIYAFVLIGIDIVFSKFGIY